MNKPNVYKYAFIAFILLAFFSSTASAICIIEYGSLKIGHISILGGLIDPIDEAYFYSDTLSVDTSYTPDVTGYGDIGNWSYEFVTVDHYGNTLPGDVDGIRFFLTSGDGISEGEYADFEFSAINSDTALWLSDYHDLASNTWTDRTQCENCVPEPDVMAHFLIGLIGLIGLGRIVKKRFA